MKTGMLAGVVLCLVVGAAGFQEASRLKPGKEPPALPPLQLPLVDPEDAPVSGTFYSYQLGDSVPPLPFNIFPDRRLYSIGDGHFVIDDRGLDLQALAEERSQRAVKDLGGESWCF